MNMHVIFLFMLSSAREHYPEKILIQVSYIHAIQIVGAQMIIGRLQPERAKIKKTKKTNKTGPITYRSLTS